MFISSSLRSSKDFLLKYLSIAQYIHQILSQKYIVSRYSARISSLLLKNEITKEPFNSLIFCKKLLLLNAKYLFFMYCSVIVEPQEDIHNVIKLSLKALIFALKFIQ
jgi:hypothetical protein